jgi:hypothetical protein
MESVIILNSENKGFRTAVVDNIAVEELQIVFIGLLGNIAYNGFAA